MPSIMICFSIDPLKLSIPYCRNMKRGNMLDGSLQLELYNNPSGVLPDCNNKFK